MSYFSSNTLLKTLPVPAVLTKTGERVVVQSKPQTTGATPLNPSSGAR